MRTWYGAASSAGGQLSGEGREGRWTVVSDLPADRLAVGRVEINDGAGAEQGLTLREAAALKRLPAETVRDQRARARFVRD